MMQHGAFSQTNGRVAEAELGGAHNSSINIAKGALHNGRERILVFVYPDVSVLIEWQYH